MLGRLARLGPDEGVGVVLVLQERRVERGGEARVFDFDAEVDPPFLAGLFPDGADFDVMQCTA